MKNSTKNSNFRTWKSGKTWLFAAATVVALGGAGAVANTTVAHADVPGTSAPSNTEITQASAAVKQASDAVTSQTSVVSAAQSSLNADLSAASAVPSLATAYSSASNAVNTTAASVTAANTKAANDAYASNVAAQNASTAANKSANATLQNTIAAQYTANNNVALANNLYNVANAQVATLTSEYNAASANPSSMVPAGTTSTFYLSTDKPGTPTGSFTSNTETTAVGYYGYVLGVAQAQLNAMTGNVNSAMTAQQGANSAVSSATVNSNNVAASEKAAVSSTAAAGIANISSVSSAGSVANKAAKSAADSAYSAWNTAKKVSANQLTDTEALSAANETLTIYQGQFKAAVAAYNKLADAAGLPEWTTSTDFNGTLSIDALWANGQTNTAASKSTVANYFWDVVGDTQQANTTQNYTITITDKDNKVVATQSGTAQVAADGSVKLEKTVITFATTPGNTYHGSIVFGATAATGAATGDTTSGGSADANDLTTDPSTSAPSSTPSTPSTPAQPSTPAKPTTPAKPAAPAAKAPTQALPATGDASSMEAIIFGALALTSAITLAGASRRKNND